MKNKIIHGDCLEVMKDIPDNSIDLIISDAPYGINYRKWDILNNDWIKKCVRLLKSDSSLWCFTGWSNVLEVKKEMEKYFILRNWVIWDRIKGRGAKYNLVSTREDILWFTKSDNYTFNKQSSTIEKKTKGMGLKNKDKFRKLSNVWTDISPIVPWSSEKTNHPTQKPLGLIERIIRVSSNKNDLVFDPFMGSGTTAVACKKLHRNFIGIEINKKYVDIANKRLQQEVLDL